MNHAKELAKNTMIIGLGNFGTKIISFLLLPLYTSYLSTTDYGVFDLLATIALFITPCATFLIEESMFRFLIDCENEKQRRKVISQSLAVILFGTVIFSIVYLLVSLAFSFEYKILLYLYILSGIAVAFRNSYYRGMGKIRTYALVNLITSIIVILANIVTITVFGLGIKGLFLSSIIVGLGSILFLMPALVGSISFRTVEKRGIKEMVRYSLPLIPNSISWSIINTSDRIVLSSFVGGAANGVYSISNKFPTVIDTVYGFFYMAWKESAARTVKTADSGSFYNFIYRNLTHFLFAVVLMMLAVMPFVFNLLVKNDFVEAYVYMPVLLISIFFANISGYYGGIFTAYKNTKIMGITTIFAAIINIVIDLLLVNSIGIWAAALSTLASTMFLYLCRRVKVQKYVKLKERIGYTVSNLLLLAVVLACYYCGIRWLQIVVLVLIAIYCTFTNRELIAIIFKATKRRVKK